MDEVHYLADRSRGAVWEEVIIHLPESVTAGLAVARRCPTPRSSASGWRPSAATPPRSSRSGGRCRSTSTSWSGKRLLDLFASSDVDAAAGFVKEGAPVNDELMKIARDDWASTRLMRDRRSPRKGQPGSSKQAQADAVGNGRRVWIPSRVDVIDRLDREGLLPAIVFIFSRVGCDAAVTQCLNAGVRLTTPGGARRDLRVRRGALPATCPRRTCTSSATTTSSTG